VSGYDNEGKDGTMKETNPKRAFARLRAWLDAKKITIEEYVCRVFELESKIEDGRLA